MYSSRSCPGIIPPWQTSIRPQGSRETKSPIGAIRVGTTARTQTFTGIGTWYNVLCGNCQYYLQVSCRDQRVGIKLTVAFFSYLYILLYRPSYLDPSDEKKQKEGRLAVQAACQCTRILEDMLSQNLIEHGMVHL